ncbi:unnamed protein product [Didymodactylos carnosus]|uniref:HAT C-terminal dimerisation domain-containing protein n=1 Tax=Didymodactylos carnosus TaxID=1234261 RepID=A0A814F5F9_9BILA|nr:unnamed protein product [Didymodactylos carnosus]CAF3748981.1 unnamed protein product [Didymodactylos carnosus]
MNHYLFIVVDDHNVEKHIVDGKVVAPDEEEEFVQKTSTKTQEDNHHRIRPDQLWTYLIARTTTNCEQMTKLISYIYSIPCSNAFTNGVFSHMKHAWTPSQNLMSSETVAAELKIRLNCR